MSKKSWLCVVILINVFLGIVLWQPFDPATYRAVVRSNNQIITVLDTDGQLLVYLSPDLPVPPPVGAIVTMSCNQGRWIPALLDCVNLVPWKMPGMLITY